MATEQETLICEICGGDEDVINGLCENCDHEQHVYCHICEEVVEGGACRHVFWDEVDCWVGPGLTGTCDTSVKHAKASVWRVLDWTGLAHDFLKRLESNTINLYCMGYLLGGPEDWYLNDLEIRAFGCLHSRRWVNEDAIEEMQLGMGWLASLGEDTPEANQQIAGWVREEEGDDETG